MINQSSIELVAWKGTGSSQLLELNLNQSVLVGRSSNCGLQLQGPDISEIHCRIGFEGGHLWVQDWMSAKGTKVNGESVSSKTKVGQGSVIEVGGFKIQISKTQMAKLEACDQKEKRAAHQHPQEPSEKPSKTVDSPLQQSQSSEPPKANSNQSDLKLAKDQKQSESTEPHSEGSMGCNFDLFADDDEVYDRETVDLLLAEIEDLRSSLAQRDADQLSAADMPAHIAAEAELPDETLQRIQELSEEANRADERVSILEEMLHASEDANRSEVEERSHLEAWVGDIEKRVGQREQEHAAELDALRERLDTADAECSRLHRQMQQSATTGDSDNKRYEEQTETLQQENRRLQDLLTEATKEFRLLQHKYENQAEQAEAALRGERAKIAKEHAEMSRLKFEYAQKIQELEEIKPTAESEVDPRLQNLREHRQYLREMSVEKEKEQQQTLSARLKRIWSLVE